MKWTTVIAAVAALFVGTQTADAGLLDFLRLNRSNKCEVKTAATKSAKPAAPKCAKPAAPKTAKGCEYEKKTTLLPRIRLPQIRRISLFNN